MTGPRLAVDVRDAAAMYGVNEATIRKALHAVEPPYLKAKKVGNKWSIPVEALADWHASLPDA